MSDISEFLKTYTETFQQEIAGADMPPELTERFDFDSCVKQQDGRAVYFVTQIREKTNFAKQGGGYIFGSDHSIPDNIPLSTYEKMVEWGMEYGKY